MKTVTCRTIYKDCCVLMADNTTIINSIGKRACDRRPPLLLQGDGDGDDDEPSLPVVLVADSPLPLNVVTMTAVLEGTAMRLLAVNMVNAEKRGQRDDFFCLETKVALARWTSFAQLLARKRDDCQVCLRIV